MRARLAELDRRRLPDDVPRAAVLVPFGLKGEAPALLFTKRTDTVGTHKGQVSFPGGHMEPDDKDEVACALRELHEELGLAPEHVEVLGPFHDMMSITGLRVTPVLGFVGALDPARLRPLAGEVQEAFALTLEELIDPTKRATQMLGDLRAPYFAAGPHPIWGLTALILDEVLREALSLELAEPALPMVPSPRR
ncbi:MAG: CoA pyrophosphatase [Deltaproteobacteria bacterium]|nr:CoA pyrophosphatase [Deltaproteobacteria bacterium]